MSEDNNEETEPKKGKPILLIIIAANVVLGGGAGAFFFLRGSGGGDAHAKPAEHGAKNEHGAPAEHGGGGGGSAHAPKVGPIVELKPILVNLNEPEGTRYLKTSIAVQLVDDKSTDAVDKAKPVIRDHFIRTLSELNFRQTMGTKNKLAIKQKLLEQFNEAMGADVGTEIHLTQFIVQ